MKSRTEALAETETASPSLACRARTSEMGNDERDALLTELPVPATQIRNPQRYRILGEHGRGARGCVSRARDCELGRDIAIKELISRGGLSEARFVREALITARLEHPGIVPVYEAGRWPDGTPFYAMKLVAGHSLRDLLAAHKAIDERIALLHHVIAVADAIAYAHGRNIIHRDLKPGNVIVGDFGETVVIDWGLAKDLSADEDTGGDGGPFRALASDDLTATGSVVGTPAYMPPEQRRGEPVDQRADVFAIGAMLWELCAQQRTPPASAAQRRRILRGAGIDGDLVSIINKAVDPDPDRRYPHAGALADDLKAFKAGARIAARRYSLPGVLAHWTRRHRAIAASVAAAIALVITGSVLYVRSVAAERDRADQERDRARISEATALLEKDPYRAKDLIAALTERSPQVALLTSRANQRAASHVFTGFAGVAGLFGAPGAAELALLTTEGELYRVDPRTGARTLLDRDVGRAVTFRAGEWLYTRQPFGADAVTIATPSNPRAFNAGRLTGILTLVSLRDTVYALDSERDLYALSSGDPALVRRGVHQIAGDARTLIICAQDGTLQVVRDGAVILERRCLRNATPEMMRVIGDDYAAVTDAGVLITSHRDRIAETPTTIRGEYELAMASTGLVAFADYAAYGNAWFVRAGGTATERGPDHIAPTTVGSDGPFVAWGYADGTVIAMETATGAMWEFKAHPDGIAYVIVDAGRRTLVSVSNRELRVWDLRASPVEQISRARCREIPVQMSPDGTQAALGCNDGGAWVWSRAAGTVAQLHQHAGHAVGVQWLAGRVCSAGWDGTVRCSTSDGKTSRTFEPGAGRIKWLAGSPDASFVAFTTDDGRVWKLDDEVHPLYSQRAVSTHVAASHDGKRLASTGLDGSLVVYDLAANRVVARAAAHHGAAVGVTWSADRIFTSGLDGALRQWATVGDQLALRSEIREAAPVRLTRTFTGGWAYSVDRGTLVIASDRGAPPIRLEIGKPVRAIDASPDARHVAAALAGEIVVVDLRDHRLATVATESTSAETISFVDAGSLVVGSNTGLKLLALSRLDYVEF